jgi:hypothetical protein
MEFVFEFEARLDEAKADFPNLATWSKGHSYEDAQQQYLDAVFAWFEKWLGLQPWEVALLSANRNKKSSDVP